MSGMSAWYVLLSLYRPKIFFPTMSSYLCMILKLDFNQFDTKIMNQHIEYFYRIKRRSYSEIADKR